MPSPRKLPHLPRGSPLSELQVPWACFWRWNGPSTPIGSIQMPDGDHTSRSPHKIPSNGFSNWTTTPQQTCRRVGKKASVPSVPLWLLKWRTTFVATKHASYLSRILRCFQGEGAVQASTTRMLYVTHSLTRRPWKTLEQTCSDRHWTT